MKTNEITSVLNEDPQAGDVLYIEAGDTLVETVIVDVLQDGIVIELDDRASQIINEGIFDKLKNVAGGVKTKIDNRVAKDALESLGYIIGVASVSGFDIVQQALGDEQFLVLSQALRMAQDSPRLRTKSSIMNGMSTAKKDVEMLDSNTIAKVIKLKFEKLQRGMSYIESSAQRSPDDPPTDFMKTTRYGELDEGSLFDPPVGNADKDVMNAAGYIVGVYHASDKSWHLVKNALDNTDSALWPILVRALKILKKNTEFNTNSDFRNGAQEGMADTRANDLLLEAIIISKFLPLQRYLDRFDSTSYGMTTVDGVKHFKSIAVPTKDAKIVVDDRGQRVFVWTSQDANKNVSKSYYYPVVERTFEAKYQGREVPLGKPMKGDVKKSKVYVKNASGNVVKVNFGDKNMKIKKSNPKRRKSFRARHNCANPGPRWKARYWSCRAW
jgi:hypothetical protein